MSRLNQFLIYDELPLWSAPFGLPLLDTIRLRKGINILDIGSGAGFPLLEIAERSGKTAVVYGIDPSSDAINMITYFKRNYYPGCSRRTSFPRSFFRIDRCQQRHQQCSGCTEGPG